MHVLFVCTGNVCRSPLAEGLAAAWAEDALGLDATRVRIDSAGTEAAVDRQMDHHSAAALRKLGGRVPAHPAKALTTHLADEADLVLTMSRRQRRAVLERSPRGLRRTFTLLEAADLVARADLTGLAEYPLEERAAELAMRLDAQRHTRGSWDSDDIRDPIGERASVHREIARLIADALRPLAAVLFEPPDRHPQPVGHAASRQRAAADAPADGHPNPTRSGTDRLGTRARTSPRPTGQSGQ